jgi:hypothetical protein
VSVSLRVISLGAGVQSTTMALMAAHGEIGPMPDCAIFADTGWEPRAVYSHLEKLRGALPFPVHIVSHGNMRDDLMRGENSTGQRYASVPWFTGNGGMGHRQCTAEYKIRPIQKKLRELLGYEPRQRIPENSVEVWLGISTDEIQRMKQSRERWQTHVWPLIDARMSRHDCIKWLAAAGWTAPKSACIGCPFHTDAMWRDMRDNDPVSWADAIEVDVAIRNIGKNIKHQQFMHRSRRPLSEVDLSTPAERGQIEFGFLQECDGMCGV